MRAGMPNTQIEIIVGMVVAFVCAAVFSIVVLGAILL